LVKSGVPCEATGSYRQTNAQGQVTVRLRGNLRVLCSRTFASMKKLLIVFHSKTGGARQMAESAAKGAASEPAVHVNLIHASDAGADELLEADGYIFATPENLAMMSGMMKDFFDRTYYAVLDRIVGRDAHLRGLATARTRRAKFSALPPVGDSARLPNRSSSAPTHRQRKPSWPPNKSAHST
jgi:NADPH-dependent FMN reductase